MIVCKGNILMNFSTIPTYNDGKFLLYEIKQTDEVYPIEYLKKINNKSMWFKELSISDKLKFEIEERKKKITMKIRIPQTKEITAMNVLKIGDSFYKVYNSYHFTNNDGFAETDLTLEKYVNPKMEEEIYG